MTVEVNVQQGNIVEVKTDALVVNLFKGVKCQGARPALWTKR